MEAEHLALRTCSLTPINPVTKFLILDSCSRLSAAADGVECQHPPARNWWWWRRSNKSGERRGGPAALHCGPTTLCRPTFPWNRTLLKPHSGQPTARLTAQQRSVPFITKRRKWFDQVYIAAECTIPRGAFPWGTSPQHAPGLPVDVGSVPADGGSARVTAGDVMVCFLHHHKARETAPTVTGGSVLVSENSL
jgi:hypothetical protein